MFLDGLEVYCTKFLKELFSFLEIRNDLFVAAAVFSWVLYVQKNSSLLAPCFNEVLGCQLPCLSSGFRQQAIRVFVW